MPNIEPFEKYAERYEQWFDHHRAVYRSELNAVAHFIKPGDSGLEIGAGTGRFAAPLGITDGVEPSKRMARIAREKGVRATIASGEDLPFDDGSFDFVLMVTTICFLDDPLEALREARRVIRDGGYVVIGFVDKESALGKTYLAGKDDNVFYRPARFFSTKEVLDLLEEAGFSGFECVQTVFGPLDEVTREQEFSEGYGEGGFVVIKGRGKS